MKLQFWSKTKTPKQVILVIHVSAIYEPVNEDLARKNYRYNVVEPEGSDPLLIGTSMILSKQVPIKSKVAKGEIVIDGIHYYKVVAVLHKSEHPDPIILLEPQQFIVVPEPSEEEWHYNYGQNPKAVLAMEHFQGWKRPVNFKGYDDPRGDKYVSKVVGSFGTSHLSEWI